MKPVKFHNFASDFVCKYDGKEYEFKSGESIMLPGDLARHFAKHLIDREVQLLGKQVGAPEQHELLKKISPELKWHDKKHCVIGVEDGEFAESKASDEDRIAVLNQPEEVKEESEEAELTRKELNDLALEKGVDEKAVKYAPNKAAVQKLIEEASDDEKPDESSFEGA